MTPLHDSTPPVVRVLSPTYTVYSTSSDSLVDLRLEWSDSGGTVNVAAVRVRALTGVSAPGTDTVNLLNHWRVERRDSSGLAAHETIDYLLHGGSNRLEVSVPDTAGNTTIDTISFVLPYAAPLNTIVTGLAGFPPATDLALCPDDGRLYMPAENQLVVIDPDSLRLVSVVPYWYELSVPLCVPGDPVLYITSPNGLVRFDRRTSQWLSRIGTYSSAGIAQSRAQPDLLYLGWWDAIVGVVSRSAGTVTGYLLPLGPGDTFFNWISVLAGDTKLYAAHNRAGIWVIDPQRGSLIDSISVGTASLLGEVARMALTKDDRRLYAGVIYGNPRGVLELNTATDQITRTVSLEPFPAVGLALSPDENRIFVTTQDNVPTSPSSNALIDVPTWRVIQALPRPRPAGEWRWDQGVVFHPNGKYVFVAHNRDVDVYLHRP